MDKILIFLQENDIDIKRFEAEAGIPERTISHALAGYKRVSPKHNEAITEQLRRIATTYSERAAKIKKLTK